MVSLRSVTVLLLGMVALHVHAASAQPTTDAGDATVPPLPPIQRLPEGCGAVAQVVSGYTSCQDVSGWAGITVDTFLALNPLLALQCDADTGGIGLQEGSVACIGDTIAYCSNVYTATSTDTCRSITKTEGTIVNIDGANDTTCGQLARSIGVPVCINPDVNKCRKDTICGLAISADLQEMLMAQPDFCDILSECQSAPELTTLEDLPTLAMTIQQQTSAVAQATAGGTHPALTSLAEVQQTNSAAALRVTLTPNWFTDEDQSGMTRFEFGEIETAARKLLATAWRPTPYRPSGFMQVMHPRRY